MKFQRVALCSLVAFAVLSHGAVEEWARAVLETGAGLLLVSWAVQQYFADREIVLPPLLLPLLALSLVAVAQLLFHRTASPFATWVDLQLLLTYAILFFVAAQAFRTADDWRGFVWFIMVFGFLIAIFGILQHLAFNGKLYWFREMRYGGIPFGPYVNRNHFAGFAELVIPIALVPLALGKVRRERWFAVGILAFVPIAALFLSASRGGIISFAVELGVLALLMVLRR